MAAFDNINQNVFGFTALVVSLVALLTTIIQVLQQYFSSAEGYRRCAASVMGKWSEGTHRKLVAREFRVEVVFETPVIFVAPPANDKGPIPNRKIHYIDGTDKSYTDTRVLKPNAQDEADKQAGARVHTADDERASWLTLLSILQRAENDSRVWDKKMRTERRPPRPCRDIPIPEYQIAVGLQSKTRSWDFIPSSITKPYATTAICHLVEMMAMLGLYWKVFDQTVWNLRAEGNGFILTSTTVHGLGVMVVFAVTGKSKFEGKRVTPCHEVKELAFGTVPNIFEDEKYQEQDEAQSLQLVFGNNDEVRSTLESLGCSAETCTRYEKDHKHMFSVAFEIIGMLGKVFRIRGSNFRMFPNPTADPWLKDRGSGQKAAWKITRLMEVFQVKLTDIIDKGGFENSHQVHLISQTWRAISALGYKDDNDLSIEVREAIHNALDKMNTYILSVKQATILSVLTAHLSKVLEILDNPNSHLNNIVLANKEEALLNYYFSDVRKSVIDSSDSPYLLSSEEEKERRHEIWITLIFRMLCWLLLHDFDKSDVRVVPANMKGSRMPIYIG